MHPAARGAPCGKAAGRGTIAAVPRSSHRLAAGLLVAGPGAVLPAKPLPAPVSRADRQWVADARTLVGTVLGETDRMASTGGTVAVARMLLRSGEGLFETAVGYGVFGICATRLRDIGSPVTALCPLESALRAACDPLAKAHP